MSHAGETLGLSAVVLFVLFTVVVVFRFVRFCLADLDSRPVVAGLPRDAWRMLIIFCIPAGGLFYLRFGRLHR